MLKFSSKPFIVGGKSTTEGVCRADDDNPFTQNELISVIRVIYFNSCIHNPIFVSIK